MKSNSRFTAAAERREAGTRISECRNALARVVAGIATLFALLVASAHGASVNKERAAKAAATFISKTYPASGKTNAPTVTPAGSSHLNIKKVEPMIKAAQTIGFIATLEPSGYVLLSADDEAPPVKLHSDQGTFEDLPPGFLKVLELEMAEDLEALADLKKQQAPLNPRHHRQWLALSAPENQPPELADFTTASADTVLTTTTWDQPDPYNYYCPAATGGSGGRALTGCNATAMAQILRYWKQPVAITKDHYYYDPWGSCIGGRNCSDAGLGAYDWNNMPNSLGAASPELQKRAVGQLMYHSGVVMQSDYEAGNTSATAVWISGNLKDYFNYDAGPQENKSDFTSSQWYNKIAVDIDASRPICYAMWERTAMGQPVNGHTLVCDGYRNGNEIHLNLGWGSASPWFNIDTVKAGGYTWTVHAATFGIVPRANNFIYVSYTYTAGDANGTPAKPYGTVTAGYLAAQKPATIRINSGHYPEALTISRPMRLESWDGRPVTIGR